MSSQTLIEMQTQIHGKPNLAQARDSTWQGQPPSLELCLQFLCPVPPCTLLPGDAALPLRTMVMMIAMIWMIWFTMTKTTPMESWFGFERKAPFSQTTMILIMRLMMTCQMKKMLFVQASFKSWSWCWLWCWWWCSRRRRCYLLTYDRVVKRVSPIFLESLHQITSRHPGFQFKTSQVLRLSFGQYSESFPAMIRLSKKWKLSFQSLPV